MQGQYILWCNAMQEKHVHIAAFMCFFSEWPCCLIIDKQWTIRLIIHPSQCFATKFNNEIMFLHHSKHVEAGWKEKDFPYYWQWLITHLSPHFFAIKIFQQVMKSGQMADPGFLWKKDSHVLFFKKESFYIPKPTQRNFHQNPRLLLWVPLTTNSVTSTQFLRANFLHQNH